jgi:hypothetical protein
VIVSAEPGLRIVLDELGCGFLFGISITFLKDTYGPFMHAIKLDELIIAAVFLPVDDFLAKFIDYHFLSPVSKKQTQLHDLPSLQAPVAKFETYGPPSIYLV